MPEEEFAGKSVLWEERKRGQWLYEDPVMEKALNSALCLGREEVDSKGSRKAKEDSDTWLSGATLSPGSSDRSG